MKGIYGDMHAGLVKLSSVFVAYLAQLLKKKRAEDQVQCARKESAAEEGFTGNETPATSFSISTNSVPGAAYHAAYDHPQRATF